MNKRFIKNLAFDLLVIYPIIAMYFYGGDLSAYAENALSFLGVFVLIASTLGIFYVDSIAETRKSEGEGKRTKLHSMYSSLSSIAEVVIFAMLGWYWVAAGFLIGTILTSMVDDRV
ncbi:TMhelix containing protein [Vibrio phage 1.223.O._10N.261.48.A9]|nr:TMhelix containing protein [Vibrio phage 1.223.O._10N.261.48.A9]